MDLNQKLAEAKDNLRECEEGLIELKTLHDDQIKSQKTLIFLARSNVRAYLKLIEKANAISSNK